MHGFLVIPSAVKMGVYFSGHLLSIILALLPAGISV